MSNAHDEEAKEGEELLNVYQIPPGLIETSAAQKNFKPDYLKESSYKIPRELVYLPGDPERKSAQTNLFMGAFRNTIQKDVVKHKFKKPTNGAEIFMHSNHYDIPDDLIFSSLRVGNSPIQKGAHYHDGDVYQIPKNLVKTNINDSILSAPVPARRELDDDYELPSRKKGSSITKVALNFQKNQRSDLNRIKSIQSIDFESELQSSQVQRYDGGQNQKSRKTMPWQIFRKGRSHSREKAKKIPTKRQNFMTIDPFVEGKREVKRKMELKRAKSITSINSIEQSPNERKTKKGGGISQDKLALFLASAKRMREKKELAIKEAESPLGPNTKKGGINPDRLALFSANAKKMQEKTKEEAIQDANNQIKSLLRESVSIQLEQAQLTYEEKQEQGRVAKETRMKKLVSQSEKLKAKQEFEALISKNIDPYIEKAKREVKIKMELQRAKSITKEDSFDKASDIPGETAPIYEKSTSLFFMNKIDRYATKDKKTDDFGYGSPKSYSRTSGKNIFNSQTKFNQRLQKRRENPSVILEASREATLPTQGQDEEQKKMTFSRGVS